MQIRMGRDQPGTSGDFGVRKVNRGEDQRFLSNAEYALVLPEVDKIAIIMLAVVEAVAVLTASPVWSTELHMLTIGAIAGLGGYNMAGRQRMDAEAIRDERSKPPDGDDPADD